MFRVSLSVRPKRRKGFASSLAIALALAGGSVLAAPAQAQSETPQYSKKFAKPGQQAADNLNTARNSPEVTAEINNLVAAVNALQAAKGADQVAAAQAQVNAVSARLQQMTANVRKELNDLAAMASNGDEKYYVGDLMDFLARFTNDTNLRIQSYKLRLGSGVLKPESVGKTWFDLARIYQDERRFDEAVPAYKEAYQAGVEDGAVYAAENLFAANRIADGLAYLKSVIDARIAAGQQVPLKWAGSGVNRAIALGDPLQVAKWGGYYGKIGNSSESWNAAIGLVLNSMKINTDSQDDLEKALDLYRLMDRANALRNKGDYLGYFQSAMGRAGIAYPGEAVKAGEAGIAAGAIQASEERVKSARDLIASDKKALPDLEKDARAAASGNEALASGDAYLSYGMDEKAEEMLGLALSKGGVDADRVNLRLGIAQADQGKFDDARASFAKVSGGRAPIAAVWLAWLEGK